MEGWMDKLSKSRIKGIMQITWIERRRPFNYSTLSSVALGLREQRFSAIERRK